ncbi:SRPBCC domain-containing protein [Pseudalkalibacillus sp. SCS-8]|uniref:SRPBCC domain-containing protein n=1 Tax=Pseudalkalibacillus nanhaiensis TaxID=3115291 RepID=UPI0032DA85C6
MADVTNLIQTKVEDRELIIERIFDAPRELVFNAYKVPEYLKQWWGPKGWSLPVCEMDFKPGGVWFYCMKCEDEAQGEYYGMESCGKAYFEEIEEPEKIVVIDRFADSEGNLAENMPAAHITYQFEDYDGKTKLISRTQYETKEALKTVLDMGVIEGMTQTLNRLEELLMELKK